MEELILLNICVNYIILLIKEFIRNNLIVIKLKIAGEEVVDAKNQIAVKVIKINQ